MRAISLSLLILLAGCQTQPKGTFCAIASPIPLTQQTIDHLTDDEVTALLRHQRLGGKLCGWRP